MSCIVKSFDKRTQRTYVYQSTSFWDKNLQAPRSVRKCIGHVDPETGLVVPNGKRGGRTRAAVADEAPAERKDDETGALKLRLQELEDLLRQEVLKNHTLETENSQLKRRLQQVSKALNAAATSIAGAAEICSAEAR